MLTTARAFVEDGSSHQDAVKEDPRVVEAMERRGVFDVDNIMVDAWCVGYFTEQEDPSRRISKPLVFVRTGKDANDNGYARPVEGLHILVDHQTMKVIEFEDNGKVHLPPPDPLRNFVDPCAPPSIPLKPLNITQPDGPSYLVVSAHRHPTLAPLTVLCVACVRSLQRSPKGALASQIAQGMCSRCPGARSP